MKIDRVTYQKIFPTGMAYLNHKIGVEVQIDDNDNPDDVFQYAKQKVEQWNLESNPSMGLAMQYANQPVPEIDPKKKDLEEKIMDCTSLEELNKLLNEAMKYDLVKQFLEKKNQIAPVDKSKNNSQ